MDDAEDKLADLIDDDNFRKLDESFGRFNLFEAVGAVRGELRHSNFLAYLLSPNEAHGLGSAVLERVLREFVASMPAARRPLRGLEIAVGELEGALVFRESDNIDLLIEIADLKLVVAIENKVDARAGDGQLAGYKKLVRAKYKEWRQLFVYLTPDRADPEDEDYLAYSYVGLAKVIDFIAEDGASPDVAFILRHYTEMLRRHIVPDDDLRELAVKIYTRHREALEFIFESRPDAAAGLHNVVRPLIDAEESLVADRHVSSIVRFAPTAWKSAAFLNACPKGSWTKTKRNVIFEVKSNPKTDRTLLALILGPCDAKLRQYLYDCARDEPSTFTGASNQIYQNWTTLYSRELLPATEAARLKLEEDKVAFITRTWTKFLEQDLPRLSDAMLRFSADYKAQK